MSSCFAYVLVCMCLKGAFSLGPTHSGILGCGPVSSGGRVCRVVAGGARHGSKPLTRSKISEISQWQKCFSELKISNPRISRILNGVRRSS